MTDLGPLFAQPYPMSPGYARGSATSRKAAANMVKGVNAMHTRVLIALLRWGPMNPDEIADRIGAHFLDVRPRCTELQQPERGHLVVATPEKRPSARGNDAHVLRLTDAGKHVAEKLADPMHAGTVTTTTPSTHATLTAQSGTHAR